MVKIVEQASLFQNLKFCAVCRRTLPDTYEGELCPACQENQLFSEVVKKWIAEGRIEYKEEEEKIANLHCSMCGETITFGTLCQKCYREKYHTRSVYATLQEAAENSKMRFLEKDDDE